MALKSLSSTLFHQHSQFTISFPKSPSSSSSSPTTCTIHESHKLSHSFSKRNLILTTFLWGIVLPNPGASLLLAQELELQRYTDSNEGFTLLTPSSWTKVDKAGATVLFQEANMASNNIGIVVSPVRLTSLGEFGTPQFVADKLLQAEKRKESTVEAEVISVAERPGKEGLQIYEFEYELDSTRGGMKRIFSAAFVASKKLYLLNIVHSDKPESPLDPHKRVVLEQVLHSFDAAT
ncbi:psbP domain-containing protein 2, chloroplastic [Lotus japonicus]|uniref:psbP domain-containing protein 2, chloroplastic n=1 Tax=Lotus japonicus TaxID=34305 RepID=UPI0025862DC5|nr:psbP domain-containing protein 2, chloroplastic [Lotus japonicus]